MANDESRRTRASLTPMLSAYRSLDSGADGHSSEAFFPADMEYWGGPISRESLRWDVGIYVARGLLLLDAPVEARIWLRNLREPDDLDDEPWTYDDRGLLLREINEAIALAAEAGHVMARRRESPDLGFLYDRDIVDGLRSTRHIAEEIFGLLLNLARWRSEDRDSTGRIEELLLKIMEQQQPATAIDADAARSCLMARFGPRWSALRGQTQEYFVTGEALFAALETNVGVAPFPLVIPYAAGLESLLRYDALGNLRAIDGRRVSLGVLEEVLVELREVNPQYPQLSESKRRLWDLLRNADVDPHFWFEDFPEILHSIGEIRNPAAHGDGSTWTDVRRIRGLTVDPDTEAAVVPKILGMLAALRDSAGRLRSADRAKAVRRYKQF